MSHSSKIKLIALALIYVLHVTFFDALMANGCKDLSIPSVSATTHQHPAKKIPAGESSYRLLTKHEQSKQALINLPHAVDFVSLTFAGFIEEQIKQPQFGASAHLNAGAFKLYRLFRVFLI